MVFPQVWDVDEGDWFGRLYGPLGKRSVPPQGTSEETSRTPPSEVVRFCLHPVHHLQSDSVSWDFVCLRMYADRAKGDPFPVL